MENIKLTISPRAREWMLAMGGVFRAAPAGIRTPSGPVPAMVCRVGAPEAGARGAFPLTSGGVTLWCSKDDTFADGEAVVDLYSVGVACFPVVRSAILGALCGGECAGCRSSCALRRCGEGGCDGE